MPLHLDLPKLQYLELIDSLCGGTEFISPGNENAKSESSFVMKSISIAMALIHIDLPSLTHFSSYGCSLEKVHTIFIESKMKSNTMKR